MITAAGAGSGIDIESILSQLNQLNQQPVNALNQKRADLDVELSAWHFITPRGTRLYLWFTGPYAW